MSLITTDIELALDYLNRGEIVAIPTETVYGLAADATNEEAIRKIFLMKNRPLNHPLIMHVAETWNLEQWVSFIPDYAHILMQHFWPGPLTLVMKCKPQAVSSCITGGQNTVALRCPQHPTAQNLLKRLGVPLVAPSANPFGKVSPTTAQHVKESFPDQNLLILDGGRCEVGIESTIVAATAVNHYQILRHGTIDEQTIQQLLPHIHEGDAGAIRAPGKLLSHYQPEKPLYCFPDQKSLQQFCEENKLPVYIISFAEPKEFKSHPGDLFYQFPLSPEKAAFELYYQLRQADHSHAFCIAIELPPDNPEWLAVRERILKASYRE
ncbi:L-threonylcarbamoyladenylate synthase [Legionella jordanis]|uniref:Threonylcarbamoyl-AMP synthase n=1 Tax=Legionella jordanis TaxID=456 RepID=A0A0W0VB72_9GAMM|nr:L-threonylcarbamoyladenylate synthase [Legionella jordanis]KTD17370.1 SUA5/yciO/yrdC family transporter:Sua5/YciO/YrdC/YwlC family transporter protein [Legionella jordanis]RMX01863.1 threonylcarbamoyl-AMP synthase [Legionella jordanis]RMX17653.1 threonylcarbamoyl-AMP synthase [Legionella jordanis]VEH11610.1 putative translation factor [Legionella jordanis]